MRFVLPLTLLTTVLATGYGDAAPKKASMEKPKPAIGKKPDIMRLSTMGLQQGHEISVEVTGTNLLELTGVKFSSSDLSGTILRQQNTNATLKIRSSANVAPGPYDLWLVNAAGESGKVKLYVDNLAVTSEETTTVVQAIQLPAVIWGALNPATDNDTYEFEARKGETVVFDVSAKSINSKANTTITLLSEKDRVLESSSSFDGSDPLLVHTFAEKGRFRIRVAEETLAGSPEHFYRLTVGQLPLVVGIYPLSVSKAATSVVELVGYNLPKNKTVQFNANAVAEMEVPIDSNRFRIRRPLKVLVTESKELVESEPNDNPSSANQMPVPAVASGRIKSARDSDYYRFTARKGQHLIVETDAARRGSPVDTKIQILRPDGSPVQQTILQAVRDSQINFRPIDSNTPDVRVENWEEMELNQLMYLQGEVCKIFRMPEGPDSGFRFYSDNGKRLSYLNTSPTAHALDEPCYIVEPHAPGSQLIANGLPVFTLNYENDDAGERKAGSDSRVYFDPPRDGVYVVRVTESRGFGGERFIYRLLVREAKPDFNVTLNNGNLVVSPGTGQEFGITVDRIDDFEGDIRVDISGIPAGFTVSTPLVIQAGHNEAKGTLFAQAEAKQPSKEAVAGINVTCTGVIAGQKITKTIKGFSEIKLGETPTLQVALEPYDVKATNWIDRTDSAGAPLEISIEPGQTLPVWLKMKRSGHDGLVAFSVENLPHGVIIDNVGLNGVLIPKGEDYRQIFLKAAKWVPETDRLVYCRGRQAGNPTSVPVLLHVRRSYAGVK
jgi:hypothetical protein